MLPKGYCVVIRLVHLQIKHLSEQMGCREPLWKRRRRRLGSSRGTGGCWRCRDTHKPGTLRVRRKKQPGGNAAGFWGSLLRVSLRRKVSEE